VAKAVTQKARKEKLSLNKAIVRLLEEAMGVVRRKEKVVHHDLEHLAGTWSEEEYQQFMAALREQRRSILRCGNEPAPGRHFGLRRLRQDPPGARSEVRAANRSPT
jgi:hypothetical protein